MKKIFKILSTFLIIFIFSTNVYATEVSKAGDNIKEKGEYNSSRFIAGNIVNSEATIDGLSFIAGNDITIDGSTTYGFYAGNNVLIKGTIEKDLFAGGNSIKIDNTTKIGRDTFLAGNNIIINTNIPRDIRAGASSIDISGITIEGDAYLYAETITMDNDTIIKGKLTISEETKVKGLNKDNIGTIKKIKNKDIDIEINPINIISNFIVSCISSLIVILVLFKLIPNTKEKLDNLNLEVKNIAKDICLGLIILIIVPIISLICLFTGILTPLSIIVICIYGISIYLSSLLVYYIVGNIINKKWINIDSKYLTLLIGILLVKLLVLLPVVGSIIKTLIILYGMGLITNYIRKRK